MPEVHHREYPGGFNYQLIRLNKLDLTGKVDGKNVKGTAYFQRVLLNSPAIPWYWGVYHFEKGAKRDLFVLYNTKDIIPGKEKECGVKAEHFAPRGDQIIQNGERLAMGCYEIDYAIASDFLMFNFYGSISAVENHNIAVTNDMQTNYIDAFAHAIQFVIVQQFHPILSMVFIADHNAVRCYELLNRVRNVLYIGLSNYLSPNFTFTLYCAKHHSFITNTTFNGTFV